MSFLKMPSANSIAHCLNLLSVGLVLLFIIHHLNIDCREHDLDNDLDHHPPKTSSFSNTHSNYQLANELCFLPKQLFLPLPLLLPLPLPPPIPLPWDGGRERKHPTYVSEAYRSGAYGVTHNRCLRKQTEHMALRHTIETYGRRPHNRRMTAFCHAWPILLFVLQCTFIPLLTSVFRTIPRPRTSVIRTIPLLCTFCKHVLWEENACQAVWK